MATGPLSPLMLIASNGLIANPSAALAANTDLSTAITEYRDYIPVAEVVTKAIAVGNAGNITASTLANLVTMGAATVPALGDAITANVANLANTINNTATFTQVVQSSGDRLLANGDLSIFAQVYGMSFGYLKQTNTYINSANNTEVIGATFTSMDALTTGGMSQVSSDIPLFGADLAAAGTTIDLARLQYLGHPWVLLRQMLEAGGILPGVYDALIMAGVQDLDIVSVQDSEPEISADLDLRIYRALNMIIGDNLSQVCFLLDVATDTANGLSTAADLLNPRSLMPQSWQTLTVQFPSGTATEPTALVTENIYDAATGQVSSPVLQFYQRDPAFLELARIIPPDQAAANLAWARSFYQIKNVITLTLPDLAAGTTAVESNAGLTFVESLNGATGPVPAAIKNQIFTDLGTGSGENGLLSLDDFMGVLSGSPWRQDIGNLNSDIANVANLSAFANVTGTYTVMIDMLDGDYGPVSGPIGNIPGDPSTYADADEALEALIANAVANIAAFQSSYPAQSTQLNTQWDVLTEQFLMEDQNLVLADVDFDQLRTSRPAILNLGTSLHSIGTDPDAGPFFASIANVADDAGQAVIAAMREGRNIESLADSGVGTDTQLPNN